MTFETDKLIAKVALIIFWLILFLAILGRFTHARAYDSADAERELSSLAKVVQREDNERERIRQLNLTVEQEANRLGVAVSDVSRRRIIRAFVAIWGARDFRVGLAIAKAESGLRCEAYHFNQDRAKSVDHSVLQINDVHWFRGDLNNCLENIKIGYQIYLEDGPYPWVTWQRGVAQQYL